MESAAAPYRRTGLNETPDYSEENVMCDHAIAPIVRGAVSQGLVVAFGLNPVLVPVGPFERRVPFHRLKRSRCVAGVTPSIKGADAQIRIFCVSACQRSIVDRDTRQDVHTRGSRWLFQPILCPALITNSETSVQPSTLQDVLEAQNNAHTGHPQYIWFCYASR